MIHVLLTKLLLISILVLNATFGGLNRNVGERIELVAKCYSECKHMGRLIDQADAARY
jgi:hypothetical protein